MKIQQITVTAGRTFNHPYEQYSNLKPSVVLVAALDESDDPTASVKKLQAQAEELVEDHKRLLLRQIQELYDLTEAQREMVSLKQNLESAQARIDALRKRHPGLSLLQIAEAGSEPEPRESVF